MKVAQIKSPNSSTTWTWSEMYLWSGDSDDVSAWHKHQMCFGECRQMLWVMVQMLVCECESEWVSECCAHKCMCEDPQGNTQNTEVCVWVHVRDCCEPQCNCQCMNENMDVNANANMNVIVKAMVNMSDCWHGALYASVCKHMWWLVMWHPCQLSDMKERCKKQWVDEDSTVAERKDNWWWMNE